MSKRRPIPAVIDDPATPSATRQHLQSVIGIREFAVRELGLPDNGSYRSYADVRRPFVVWNVFATPEFSVEPRQWCFPIAGCVAYRGYFNLRQAQNFAARLKKQGLDVSFGGVAAYSTLGHFADPVLNTMMGWSDAELAGIIFHELTHQLIYVPGDSKFNEALATVVEEEGVKRWLSGLYPAADPAVSNSASEAAQLRDFLGRKRRYLEFAALVGATRERLRKVYASGVDEPTLRRDKQAAFADLKDRYALLRAQWNGNASFDSWFARDLNNAHLVAVATYQDCVPGLERLLATESGGDLQRFYARMRELSKLTLAQRHAVACIP